MSGKNIIFDDKKVKKSDFYKNKKVIEVDDTDVNKYQFQKKNHMLQISQLNISLDIMMMLLDH